MFRAIELDPKWAKAYSRLAEVFFAQHRYADAHATYAKAMEFSDEKQKKVYQMQREKVAKLMDSSAASAFETASTVDGSLDSSWFIKAMERDIPNPSMYKSIVPCPLGYLTAADKVYCAYPTFPLSTQTVSSNSALWVDT